LVRSFSGLIQGRVNLAYSAMHEQEGTIPLFAAAKCPKMDAPPPDGGLVQSPQKQKRQHVVLGLKES